MELTGATLRNLILHGCGLQMKSVSIPALAIHPGHPQPFWFPPVGSVEYLLPQLFFIAGSQTFLGTQTD